MTSSGGRCDTASSPSPPAEQRRLGSQVLDVRARLTPAGQHRHGMSQHPGPIVEAEAFPAVRHAADSEWPSPRPVGKAPSACNPTWATIWSPPGSKITETGLFAFT